MQTRVLAYIIGMFLLAGLSVTAAYGQSTPEEVHGTYVVDIPDGAYKAGAEHYLPANIAVPVGTTVVWFNDDPNQPHTVTSGTPEELGAVFDSNVLSEGGFFQYTFNEPGEVQYFCELHPGMTGSIFVNAAYEQGHDFKINYGTGPIFDFTEHERTLLYVEPTSVEIPEDEPVTYEVAILKNDEEVFSEEFRTLGGHLYVELVPTDGPTRVHGPDVSDPVIGAYHIEGSLLKDNAAYKVRTEITQRFSGPPADPIIDEFGVQIVPEFPVGAVVPVLAGIGTIIMLGRKKLNLFKF